MKEDTHYHHLDATEIVFEKRNQKYGAFILRKSYYKNLFKAMSIAIFAFVFAAAIPLILDHFHFFEEEPQEILIRRDINLADAPPPSINDNSAKTETNAVKEFEAVEKGKEDKKTLNDTTQTKGNDPKGTDTLGNWKNGNGNNPLAKGDGKGDAIDIGKVEIKPIFKGGDEAYGYFFEDNLIHPNRKLSGTVYVSFIIEKNGDISNISTDGKQNAQLEKAAIECIAKMKGNWTPAKQGGQNVRVICKVPVEF